MELNDRVENKIKIQGGRGMNSKRTLLIMLAVMLVLLTPVQSRAFESGSTGADGAFNPTADTVLQMPEDGIFNFTTVNIPAGVTVTFKKNSKNTPVYILATGDVIIEGTISVNGGNAINQSPGEGGPGGFDGGAGSFHGEPGGNGLGPGGGQGGPYMPQNSPDNGFGGGGGGYGTAGKKGCADYSGSGGMTYGTTKLLPITGGSGGGGGSGGNCSGSPGSGGGGGGGGGALVIASSTKIVVSGSITADGGNGGKGSNCYSAGGGGGSGGAIRLIASTISGSGSITAKGGSGNTGTINYCSNQGGKGGLGRIRLEADHLTFTSQTTPAYTAGRPSSVFVTEVPTIRIVEVGGIAVPANATGRFGTPDVSLPLGTENPVSVKIEASKIPVGTVVKLTSTPEYGSKTTATGTLSGTFDSSSTTIDINLSTEYQCILTAEATFTMQTTMYFDGEKIEKVRVAGSPGSGSKVTYITETGREVKAEEVLARATYHLP